MAANTYSLSDSSYVHQIDEYKVKPMNVKVI